MGKSCVYRPNKGTALFDSLRKNLSYNTSWNVYYMALSDSFKNTYKKSLELDSEGIPTYESLMKNPLVKQYIGMDNINNVITGRIPDRKDTIENYNTLVDEVKTLNETEFSNSEYLAVVRPKEDGKIGISVVIKDDSNIKEVNEQQGVRVLNRRLGEIFRPLGITPELIAASELGHNQNGLTDFSKAKGLANDFASIIRVANNMKGEKALSEEFSHLIIGALQSYPLVQRALNTLKSDPQAVMNILGEEYETYYSVYSNNPDFDINDILAEEALGKILQNNLLKNTEVIETPAPSLFKRLYNYILSLFKNFRAEDVTDAVSLAENSMNELSRKILGGDIKITKEDVKESNRNLTLYNLEDRINRNIKIINEGIRTEIKRYKIYPGSNSRQDTKILVDELKKYTSTNADTVLGILKYAQSALKTLKGLEHNFQNVNDMTSKQKFFFLRNVYNFIQSYGDFLNQMTEAIIEEGNEEDDMFVATFEINGQEVNVKDIIKDLDFTSKSLTKRFLKVSVPAFAEILTPFLGESITIPYGKDAGKTYTVEDLLKETRDITFFDRWLQSTSNSADPILAGVAALVKKQKTKAKTDAIDYFNKVHIFREKAEKAGVKNFDWAFETDNEGNKTGNYISPINYGQFEKDLKEMLESLDEKYGKHTTGENAKKKLAEKNSWLDAHADSIFGEPIPNSILYKNDTYYSLSDTQRELLSEFKQLKMEADVLYPDNKRPGLDFAIQIRKGRTERLWESLGSPSHMWSNFTENLKSTFLVAEDDYTQVGDTKSGMKNFDGTEYMALPVFYTQKLANPNELSTDLIGTLMAHGYMAIQYSHLEDVLDALEVGRQIMQERKVVSESGGKKIEERISALGSKFKSPVYEQASKIVEKYNDFLDCQVYHRYLKDEGTFGDTKLSKTKATSFVLRMSSVAQMGFNLLANIANVNTGLCMQNIEAVAGQFFGVKDLLKADKEYTKNIMHTISELNSRSKTGKLDLFFELFDVKQGFESNSKRLQTRKWLQRIFGENIAFLGQTCGDHWLYGRTAIAMALRTKVLLNGEEMSLWDALQVKDVIGSDNIKELNWREIKNLDGSKFDVDKFSRSVADVNHTCFGIYNEEDMNAANRVSLGRLAQQYRKWMVRQYSRRFRKGVYNVAQDSWEEGYYRTVGRLMTELVRGGFQWQALKDNMTENEKQNVKRAFFEFGQWLAVWAALNFINWPDDKNRPWAVKLAEYSAGRLNHELGGLTVTTNFPNEVFKTVRQPIPSMSVIEDAYNLVKCTANPVSWFSEIEQGKYKGMTQLERAIVRAPIPIARTYKQIDKFTGNVESQIGYYVRPF